MAMISIIRQLKRFSRPALISNGRTRIHISLTPGALSAVDLPNIKKKTKISLFLLRCGPIPIPSPRFMVAGVYRVKPDADVALPSLLDTATCKHSVLEIRSLMYHMTTRVPIWQVHHVWSLWLCGTH